MTEKIAIVGCGIFVVLGMWHIYWALGGAFAKAAAIPEVDGAPAFSPSRGLTALVGVALFCFALLLVVTSGLFSLPVPADVLSWLCYALALALFARAVGEFRLVGFFKRVRGTRFASLDTWIYSPLCLGLSVLVFAVGDANMS
jgi:hypothetical protein